MTLPSWKTNNPLTPHPPSPFWHYVHIFLHRCWIIPLSNLICNVLFRKHHIFKSFLGKNQVNGLLPEKWQDRKSKRTGRKNKRGDRKGESNDSPEIPGMGKNQTPPASLLGLLNSPYLGESLEGVDAIIQCSLNIIHDVVCWPPDDHSGNGALLLSWKLIWTLAIKERGVPRTGKKHKSGHFVYIWGVPRTGKNASLVILCTFITARYIGLSCLALQCCTRITKLRSPLQETQFSHFKCERSQNKTLHDQLLQGIVLSSFPLCHYIQLYFNQSISPVLPALHMANALFHLNLGNNNPACKKGLMQVASWDEDRDGN